MRQLLNVNFVSLSRSAPRAHDFCHVAAGARDAAKFSVWRQNKGLPLASRTSETVAAIPRYTKSRRAYCKDGFLEKPPFLGFRFKIEW